MVKINGTLFDVTGQTLSEYLSAASYDIKRIAVERNGVIVPKVRYCDTVLENDDIIEIVRFVGGG